MDENYLRMLLQAGQISPQEFDAQVSGPMIPQQNALAQILNQGDMPQPRYDIAPMQQNTMRAENGPDAGRVTSLNFRPDQGSPMGAPMGSQQSGLRQASLGTDGILSGGNARSDEADVTRPVEIAGFGKGYYAKDGRSAIINGTKVALGVDRDASYQAAKRDFERRQAEATISHTNEATAASQQARTAKEGLPGYGTPQSLLEKQFGKAPEGQRWNLSGELEDIPGGSGKPLNESQAKAAGMATRAQSAHDLLMGLEGGGVTTPGLIKQAAESVPVLGGILGTAVNRLPGALGGPSTDQQKVEQAQRDFVNAVLRPESGASISASEFDNARRQYFPQPGDSTEVITQKQQARERELGALNVMAGSGGAKVINKQNAVNTNRAQSIPQSAIDYLKANPMMSTAFDMKYGSGAASRVLGR